MPQHQCGDSESSGETRESPCYASRKRGNARHHTIARPEHSSKTKQPTQLDPSCCECPICVEHLSEMEWRFRPCPCGFRLCAWCLHLIRQGDGKCPQCREFYSETRFKDLSEKEAGLYIPARISHKIKSPKRKVTTSSQAASLQVRAPVAPPAPRVAPPPPAAPPVRIERFRGGLGAWD